jgi:Reverse transcriptase (RNA-dependent DNA polymerase)
MTRKLLDVSECSRGKWMTQIRKHSDTRQDLWLRVIASARCGLQRCVLTRCQAYLHTSLELKQLDVKTAFLYGDLDEQIYMKQPEGFEITGKEDHVCLLKKSLYGLKQSPRQWYKKFDSFMVNLNFSRSNYDSCVYLKRLDDGDYIYLLFYVDDILIAATNMGEIKKLKEQLSMAFEMKDLGAAKKIFGMKIIRDWSNQKLFLSQKEFAENVISGLAWRKQRLFQLLLRRISSFRSL